MEQEQTTKKKTSPVTWLVLIVFVIIVAVVVDSASDAEQSATNGVNDDVMVSRCLPVPDSVARGLNEGLNIDEGGSVTNLRAVKSEDFESVYFISGILQGPGLGRETDLITFVTNKLDTASLTLSADAVAVEFSDWPDIAATNLLGEGGVSRGVVISSDGYDESRDCVSNS